MSSKGFLFATVRLDVGKFVLVLLVFLTLSLCSCDQQMNYADGNWVGSIKNPSGEEVTFRLEVKREGNQFVGSLVNGDERITSTKGSFDGKILKLEYDFYDAELIATIDRSEIMEGEFTRQWQKQTLKRDLRAMRIDPGNKQIANVIENVGGEWIMRVGEAPKQSLWRAAFLESGNEVTGTIIPVSGDWGEMSGSFENGELRLNRFDGINCRVFRAKLTPQGKLEGIVDFGLFDPIRKVLAERITDDNKDIVANLPDPFNHTRMKNSVEPFRFSFPDLEGKAVSSTDERFKNKVVAVSITGSWCPNCHEESPFLQQMYDRYRDQGFEAVALAFEYTGEYARDLEQVKIFAKRHNLKYPVLLAGSTEEGDIQKKLPQLENFGAYPTTIFIGRDGLVKRIHAGFDGKATGERHEKLKAEIETLIKELLAGKDS